MSVEKECFDRQVLEMRKQYQAGLLRENAKKELEENPLDICSGKALINGDIVLFSRMKMMEDNISMMVPSGFLELDEETKTIIYDEDYQPQFVYSNHDSSITVFFDALFSDADEEGFELVRKEMIRDFRKEFGDLTLKWDMFENQDNEEFYYFIRKDKKETGMNYVITFLFLVKGFLVMGTLSVVGFRLKDWKEVVFQMVESILVEETGEQVDK